MRSIFVVFGSIFAVACFVLFTSPYVNMPMPDSLPVPETIIAKGK